MRPPLTNIDLSTIAGYQSLACWIIVYSPQILENYTLKSGEGLSVAFIVIWLAGDLTNLIGGVLAGVLPTMIMIAVYYTICDFILLFQVYYYRKLARERASRDSERSALLKPDEEAPQEVSSLSPWITYPLLMLFVQLVGFGAWAISSENAGSGGSGDNGPAGGIELEWRSQVLGYASCVLYIGSRVPQIIHNYHTRCEGLSLAMFLFSITGNITYVASILFTSLDRKYLIANASWIAGAALTIVLDIYVLGQFAVFAYQDRHADKVFAEDDVADEL